MSVKSESTKKYKLVPPDGGYGYVICFACILMLAPTGGFRSSFSMMYHDLMNEIGMDSTKIGLVSGCNVMSFSLTGFLTGSLLKVLSFRQAALLATALFNLGSFSSAFAQSATTFILCQSLLQNAGFGILYNLVFTTMKDYFSKKRLLAVSLIQTSNAIASVCVPFLIKGAADYFGHRGMLIFISGISIQSFIGVSLLQPVAWHMKKLNVLEEKTEEIKTSANSNNPEYDRESKSPTTNGKNEENANASESNTQSSFKLFMKGLIDVKILKEFGLSRTCLGLSTVFVADILYSLMITRAFYTKGMSREYVASSMSLIATGDLTMRILFTLFSERLKKLKTRELYTVGTFLGFLARSGTLLSDNKTSILVFLTITGMARSFSNTLIPVLIADTVPPEEYSASLGIAMLIIGMINMSLGPIAGATQDYTNNYDVVLWSITLLFLAVTILFAIDTKVQKEREKKD